MFITGAGTATALTIARYQAQAMNAVDKSAARIAANRRFTSFAEDPVSATREITLRAQQGATSLYLRATQDAAAAADSASEGLRSASDILIDLRTAVAALNTGDPNSITATQQTVNQLNAELNRIGKTTTTLAGKNLLDGSIASTPLTFTIAAGGGTSNQVDLKAIKVDTTLLGTSSVKLADIDFTTLTPTSQADALDAIDAARSTVADSLGSTAAVASAMEFHANALGMQASALDDGIENLVGVDVAEETLEMTKNRLRAETATAMLAQINALHASIVQQLLMGR